MKKLLLLLTVATLVSCTKDHTIERSFCYWDTTISTYSINQKDKDSLGVTHMYMRLFDIGWNPYEKKALPIATLWDFSDETNRMQVTPSVYITNDVVLNSTRPQLAALALNIKKRIHLILEQTGKQTAEYVTNRYNIEDYTEQMECQEAEQAIFDTRIKDILIDCDWTLKSKDNYFYLLEEIKKALPEYALEATIRLWQYRDYELAGIPPADKGLLMCYNMTNPSDRKTENSIGSAKELEKYITHDDYPLKLNVALPVFQWALVFRGNKFLGILPNENIDFTSSSLKKKDDTHYVFTHDKVIGETYYRNGDEIRVEKVSDAELKKMTGILKDHVDLENSRVTFFSWNAHYIKDYGIKTISGYYSLFSE